MPRTTENADAGRDLLLDDLDRVVLPAPDRFPVGKLGFQQFRGVVGLSRPAVEVVGADRRPPFGVLCLGDHWDDGDQAHRCPRCPTSSPTPLSRRIVHVHGRFHRHVKLIFRPYSSLICSNASALPRASSTGWWVCLVFLKCLKLVNMSLTTPL